MAKQGQSLVTPLKEHDLSEILHYLFSIHRAILKKNILPPFLHCDANSGSGINKDVCCEGSPRVFIRAAYHYDFLKSAFFIEIEKEYVQELIQNIPPFNWITIINEDNKTALPKIIDTKSTPWTHGLIYHDPNGYPDFELLEEIFKKENAKRLDILIRLEATTIKRCRTAFPDKGYQELGGHLARIKKSDWLIQEPQTAHQFSFLLGSNWPDLSTLKKIGLHLLASDEGRSIFDRLNYTKNEIEDEHPKLPYDTYEDYSRHPKYLKVRAEAIARAAGRCEICGNPLNGNINVHHVAYPPWGTFEKDASKLLAICYPCHCKVHGKES